MSLRAINHSVLIIQFIIIHVICQRKRHNNRHNKIIKLKIVVLYKRFVTKKGWSHFRDQPLVGSCYTIFLLFFITNPKPAKPASMIPRK